MERKIGEIFEFSGEWYQCIGHPYNECTDCDFCFETGKACVRQIVGQCSMSNRSDGLSVAFKRLEKVGEPFSCNYYGDSRLVMMQEYQLFDSNVIYYYQTPPMYITDYKHKRIAIELKQTKEDMEENKTTFPKEDNALTRAVYAYVNGKISDKELIRLIKKMSDEYPYNKNNIKPFSLELAKQGKPVCTRDGHKARIICFDAKGMHQPIIALITQDNGIEYIETYYSNGRFNDDINSQSDYDLMMLPEKKEGWVNVYKGGLLDTKSYPSRKEAYDKASPEDYVDTIKINWEE